MKIIVKNRKLLVFIVLLISSAVSKGQIYKYIGLEDGLNNQKIYHIQKDRRGYMWFLTQEGVDRYDGKHIKHYTFSDDSMKLDSRIALNWLYMDQEDVLWVIGQKGRIFRYDSQHDKFELAYVHPELIRNKFQAFLDYGYLDKKIIFGYVTKIQLPGIIFVLEQHNICQSLSMVQYLLLSRLMAVIFLSVREAVCFVSG